MNEHGANGNTTAPRSGKNGAGSEHGVQNENEERMGAIMFVLKTMTMTGC